MKFLTRTGRLGEKKDKFKTKALDPNSIASYIVRALAFSPDSTKLAVAQSDQCVFVYKSVLSIKETKCSSVSRLGVHWNEKKAICNKFHCPAALACLYWPQHSSKTLFYGALDGSLRSGVLDENKSRQVHSHATKSPVFSVHCLSQQDHSMITVHQCFSSLKEGCVKKRWFRLCIWMDPFRLRVL